MSWPTTVTDEKRHRPSRKHPLLIFMRGSADCLKQRWKAATDLRQTNCSFDLHWTLWDEAGNRNMVTSFLTSNQELIDFSITTITH